MEAIVLLHRVVSLMLVLVGVGAGWLARGAEVPEAEAKGAVWRCLFVSGNGYLGVHNPTDREITANVLTVFADGTVPGTGTDLTIAPRAIGSISHGSARTMVVTSGAPILVDAAQFETGGNIRQAACHKGK